MDKAYDLDTGRDIRASDAERLYPITFRGRRYMCPRCGDRVVLVLPDGFVVDHFRHHDSVPDCPLYTAGDGSSGTGYVIDGYRIDDFFTKMGFKPFYQFAEYAKMLDLNVGHERGPNYFAGKHFVWVKDLDQLCKASKQELMDLTDVLAAFSNIASIHLFLTNPALLYPERERKSKMPWVIPELVDIAPAIFEVPPTVSLQGSQVRLWRRGKKGGIGGDKIITMHDLFAVNKLIIENKGINSSQKSFRFRKVPVEKVCGHCHSRVRIIVSLNPYGGLRAWVDNQDIKKASYSLPARAILCKKCNDVLLKKTQFFSVWQGGLTRLARDEIMDAVKQMDSNI
jgi:uncharacterized protein YlaI